jgi:GAF domain-containing protein
VDIAPKPFSSGEPPAWFVTNGSDVVGPVPTQRLLRGVAQGIVRDEYSVWQKAWSFWRPLSAVRAIGGFSRAVDAGEVTVLALQAAAAATGASIGLVHRTRKVLGGLEARGAFGMSAWSLLGTQISSTDPAMVAARFGPRLIRLPAKTRVGRASLSRLGENGQAPLRGIVLAPIYANNRLAAILELGHARHAFRQSDLEVLRQVTRAASAQMGSR